MKQTDPHFKIRLPPDLKDRLVEAARTSGRSINAEIVVRLEGSFAGAQRPIVAPGAIDELQRELIKFLDTEVKKATAKMTDEVIDRLNSPDDIEAYVASNPGKKAIRKPQS